MHDFKFKRTSLFVKAGLGWNRKEIETALKRRNQAAVRALGMLPIEDDQELLDRYLYLKKFPDTLKKKGPEKRANENAAVLAGLSNLAMSAGYHDRERLEWDMESRIAEHIAAPGREWEVEGYKVALELEGGDAKLHCIKGKKALKSVPAKVKKSEHYKEMSSALEQLKAQVKRFRDGLEKAMASDNPLSQKDAFRLARLPAAREIMSRLIFMDRKGSMGLFIPEYEKLSGLGGEEQELDSEGGLTIVHPHHLYKAEVLAEWQAEIVNRRIVQPFKQAFRELYFPVEAEKTSRVSRRFAEHLVSGSSLFRILVGRDWTTDDTGTVFFREFPVKGIKAKFELPYEHNYIGGAEVVTGPLEFIKNTTPFTSTMELGQVPPVIFSECMRDMDLVVNAAAVNRERISFSDEYVSRKQQALSAILDNLELENVSWEGEDIVVRGNNGEYFVDIVLGLVVRTSDKKWVSVDHSRIKKRDKVYLPFADEKDTIYRVIQTVMALAEDDSVVAE